MSLGEAFPGPNHSILKASLFQYPSYHICFTGILKAVGDQDRRTGEHALSAGMSANGFHEAGGLTLK